MRASTLTLAVLLAGCGRVAFDRVDDGGEATADGLPPKARSTLTLDKNLPSERLLNFPLPIVLDGTRADLALLDPQTLRVFRESEELHVELETGAGSDPMIAWVRLPSVELTATVLTIEYGGARGTLHDVWDDSYLLVIHANNSARDSSRAQRPYASSNVGSTSSGKLGGAGSFDPALQSCLVIPSFSNLATPVRTLSAWIRTRNPTPAGQYYTAITRQLGDTTVDDFILGLDPNDRTLGAIATNTTGSPSRTGTSILATGTWSRLLFTYDGAQSALFVNTVAENSGIATGTPLTGPRPLFAGCGRNTGASAVDVPDGDFLDGDLDEIRVESEARSSAWVFYEWFAQSDLAITYGPIERL